MAKRVVILIFLPEARKVLQVNLRRAYANYDISLHSVYNKRELRIELHSGSSKLVAYGLDKANWDISVECKINYCPMCGRKLQ